MTRLTAWQRDRITAKVLDDTFAKREVKLKEREHALALRVRDHILGKHKATYLALPAGLVCKSNGFRVSVDGMYTYLNFAEESPCPPCAWDDRSFSGDSVLGKALHKLIRADEAILKDRQTVERETRAVLNSVTTVKRLLEVWPAAKQYLPEETAMQLPAVRVEDLEARIAAAKKAA